MTVIANELVSTETRLRELHSREMNIIQFSLLLLGVVAVGYFGFDRHPEVLAILPLFWSVWMMYALTVDRDTIKSALYAKHLEDRANRLLELIGGRTPSVGCGCFQSAIMADRKQPQPTAEPGSLMIVGLVGWTGLTQPESLMGESTRWQGRT